MLKIRHVLILLGMLLSPVASADVQVSVGIGLPHLSIGINVPVYPRLVVVPGYPVYYAPQLQANFFFYDGMYWVYQDDYWYASSWYNGPWSIVGPEFVPVYVLRIPVRYYRHPPAYFRGWRADAPPRWGDHWGRNWEQQRSDWDRWDRRSAPTPAPLPTYQQQYSGERYPRQVEQQYELHQQNYRYQPSEPVVRKHYEEQIVHRAPARQENSQQERQGAPGDRDYRQQDMPRSLPPPRSQPSPQGGVDTERSTSPASPQGRPETQGPRQSQPGALQRDQPMPKSPQREPGRQGNDGRGEPDRGQGQGPSEDHEPGQAPEQGQRSGQGKGPDQEPRHDQGQGQGRDREQEQEPGGWDRTRDR